MDIIHPPGVFVNGFFRVLKRTRKSLIIRQIFHWDGMMSPRAKQIILPLTAALIWGTAFVAQDVCADSVPAFTFNTVRCFAAFVVLMYFYYIIKAVRMAKARSAGEELQAPSPEERRSARRTLFIAALLCGTVLSIASNLQQAGMQLGTDSGKAGFITALYIVLVPIGGLFLKKRVPALFWLGVALAVAGLYLLCISSEFTLTTGDLLMLLCAVAFTVQILLIDRYSPHVDSILLCAWEFFVAGIWSALGMLVFESPDWAAVWAKMLPIMYVAVFSSGVAYLLQIVAQKQGNPSLVSLLFSMEAVFAVIASAIILGQRMTAREYAGCALMLAAVIVAQLVPQRQAGRS